MQHLIKERNVYFLKFKCDLKSHTHVQLNWHTLPGRKREPKYPLPNAISFMLTPLIYVLSAKRWLVLPVSCGPAEIDRVSPELIYKVTQYMQVGISNGSFTNKYERNLDKIFIFSARKCILQKWIIDKFPITAQSSKAKLDYVLLFCCCC